MSHFTVLVSARDRAELEAKLLPYHEYECTGIEEYVEFVPVDMGDAAESYARFGNEFSSLDEFIPEWYGAVKNEEGIWGRRTNPNAKWDWWMVGGRWSGSLPLKKRGAEGSGLGAESFLSNPVTDPMMVDYAFVKDIDWQRMRQAQDESKWDWWRKCQAALAEASPPQPKYIEEAQERHDNDGRYREFFPDVMDAAIFEEASDSLLKDHHILTLSWGDVEKMYMTEKEYGDSIFVKGLTYAFVDEQGNWNQRGEMGWWGMDDPNRATDDYEEAWWRFVTHLPEDTKVWLVDCHI